MELKGQMSKPRCVVQTGLGECLQTGLEFCNYILENSRNRTCKMTVLGSSRKKLAKNFQTCNVTQKSKQHRGANVRGHKQKLITQEACPHLRS
jgi:hypothetical protein